MKIKGLFLCSLTAVCSGAFAHAQDLNSFTQGLEAFKQERYQEAANLFLKAKASGFNDVSVNYNLGVAYFRLDQYRLARQEFMEASKTQKYQQMAHYNLGLVSQQEGNITDALHWFNKAARKDGNEQITDLANRMIEKLDASDKIWPFTKAGAEKSESKPAASSEKRKVTGEVRLGYGHSSTLVALGSETAIDRSAEYYEASGYVDIPVHNHFVITLDGFAQEFLGSDSAAELAAYSQYGIAARYEMQRGDWYFEPSVGYYKGLSGGSEYLDGAYIRFRAIRALTKNSSLGFSLTHTDFESQDIQYNYLEGDQQKYQIDYTTKLSLGKLRLRYEHEENDRNYSTANFAPESRDGISVRLKRDLAPKWDLTGEFGYRESEFDSSAAGSRTDERLMTSLDVGRAMNKNWRLGGMATYVDNDSNVNSASYHGYDVQVYTSWSF